MIGAAQILGWGLLAGGAPDESAKGAPVAKVVSVIDDSGSGRSEGATLRVGLGMDLGLPEGLGLGPTFTYDWLQVSAAGTYNLFGLGLRLGASVFPLGETVSPGFTLEVGHVFNSDLRAFMTDVLKERVDGAPEEVSLTYANAHVGVRFEGDKVEFQVRAGATLIAASATPTPPGQEEGLRFEESVSAIILSPSAKLSLVFYP